MGGRKWEQKEINANPEDYKLLPNVYLDILMFYFQKTAKFFKQVPFQATEDQEILIRQEKSEKFNKGKKMFEGSRNV